MKNWKHTETHLIRCFNVVQMASNLTVNIISSSLAIPTQFILNTSFAQIESNKASFNCAVVPFLILKWFTTVVFCLFPLIPVQSYESLVPFPLYAVWKAGKPPLTAHLKARLDPHLGEITSQSTRIARPWTEGRNTAAITPEQNRDVSVRDVDII